MILIDYLRTIMTAFRSYFTGLAVNSHSPEVGNGGNLSREFDPLFLRYGRGLPVPFLRALGYGESKLNPKAKGGTFWGLLQVGFRNPDLVSAYNQKFGTDYKPSDLLDPAVNIQIATDLLTRIATAYRENFPRVPNMQTNFRNPEFVRLLVAGWNSGYSKKSGVQKVVSYLLQNGIPVTHKNVFNFADDAGATKHLQNNTKFNWQRAVVRRYFAQPDASKPPTRPPSGLVAATLIGLTGLLLAVNSRS